MVGSIAVVGVLTRGRFFRSLCELKAIQMNVLRSLNRELILYWGITG